MDVYINGQACNLPDLTAEATVADLVSVLGMKPDRVAVEQNREIVPRDGWSSASVHAGDRFEIVHFVGGGAC